MVSVEEMNKLINLHYDGRTVETSNMHMMRKAIIGVWHLPTFTSTTNHFSTDKKIITLKSVSLPPPELLFNPRMSR